MDAIRVLHTVPIRHVPRRGVDGDRVSFDQAVTPVEPLRADPGDLLPVEGAGPGHAIYGGARWQRLTTRSALGGGDPGPPLGEATARAYLEGTARGVVNTPLSMALIRTPVCAWDRGSDLGQPQGKRIPGSRRLETGADWIEPAVVETIRGSLLFVDGLVYSRMSGPAQTLGIPQIQGRHCLTWHALDDVRSVGGGGDAPWFATLRGRPGETEALVSSLMALLPRGTLAPAAPAAGPVPEPEGDEDLVLMANVLAVRARRQLLGSQGLDPRTPGVAELAAELAPYEIRGYVGAVDHSMADDVFRLVARAADVAREFRGDSLQIRAMEAFATEVALPRLRAGAGLDLAADDALALGGLGG